MEKMQNVPEGPGEKTVVIKPYRPSYLSLLGFCALWLCFLPLGAWQRLRK